MQTASYSLLEDSIFTFLTAEKPKATLVVRLR